MKYILFSFILLAPTLGYSKFIEVLKYNELEERVSKSNDTLYIVNYWSTYCPPCVKEIPDL